MFAAIASVPRLAGADSDEIVTLYTTDSHSSADDRLASMADFVAWKFESATISETALYASESHDISFGSFRADVDGYAVWVSFFDVIGMRPLLGRSFLPEEKEPNTPSVVILSYHLWQAFGGDPSILGKIILVDGQKRTIVGVMPKQMDALGPGRILIPFVPAYVTVGGHDREFHVIASVKPGVTLAQVQKDLDLLDQKRHQREPKYPLNWKARVAPMKQL